MGLGDFTQVLLARPGKDVLGGLCSFGSTNAMMPYYSLSAIINCSMRDLAVGARPIKQSTVVREEQQ